MGKSNAELVEIMWKNRNIGCIEMEILLSIQDDFKVKNRNIRCIEIQNQMSMYDMQS